MEVVYQKILNFTPLYKQANNQNKTFMRKKILRKIIAYSGMAIVLFQSCKDDSKLTLPVPPSDQSFTESFDNYDEAYAKGWISINKSTPAGRKWYDVAETPNLGSPNYVSVYYPGWNQAQFTLDSLQFPNAPYPGRYWKDAFASQRGSNGYVATSIACADIIGTSLAYRFNVNAWLISPELTVKNGDKIVFYAFSKGLSHLQLWLNPTTSLYVGTGENALTGDFKINLVDINPGLAKYETNPALAFPREWTRFEGEVRGLTKPVQGRFGFRYFLPNQPLVNRFFFPRDPADPNNETDSIYNVIHRSVIGIDEVSFKSAE